MPYFRMRYCRLWRLILSTRADSEMFPPFSLRILQTALRSTSFIVLFSDVPASGVGADTGFILCIGCTSCIYAGIYSGVISDSSSGKTLMACSMACSNSRTLPGQSYAWNKSSVAGSRSRALRESFALHFMMNCFASSGISSFRSRSGGIAMLTTPKR